MGRDLLEVCLNIAASAGLACHSETVMRSEMLLALGLSPFRARGALRHDSPNRY